MKMNQMKSLLTAVAVFDMAYVGFVSAEDMIYRIEKWRKKKKKPNASVLDEDEDFDLDWDEDEDFDLDWLDDEDFDLDVPDEEDEAGKLNTGILSPHCSCGGWWSLYRHFCKSYLSFLL